MRRFSLFPLLLGVLLSGCIFRTDDFPSPPLQDSTPPVSAGGAEPEPSPDISPEPAPVPSPDFPEDEDPVNIAEDWADNGFTVQQALYQNTFTSGGRDTLVAYGSFPQVGRAEIDAYFAGCRDDFARMCEAMAEDAARDRITHQCDADFVIECSAGGLLSLTRTVHKYTGGVHGITDILCETFSVSTGGLLTLDDFFSVGRDEYTARLLESVRAEIDADPYQYYDDAGELVEMFFPYDTFCVTKNGISLLFPEYNIAPYVAGIIRIDVPWSAVADIFQMPG